jgi:uncharacterized protein YcaQ/nicotinamidase-related amidase
MLQDNPVLVVIDIQAGFDDPKWGSRNNPAAEANVSRFLGAWRQSDLPVVHTQHLSTEHASPLRPDQPGCEFKPETLPESGETVFAKRVNSAFIGTELESYLRRQGHNTLVIVGLTTNHCVSTTARMAGNLGFETYVVSDATATFESKDHEGRHYSAEEVHALSLANLHDEFATIISTEAVIDSLRPSLTRGKTAMETLTVTEARRLALARAGLMKPEWTGFPVRAKGSGQEARQTAIAIMKRFGYLQLDTVSIAGARSHTIVLLSRLKGFAPTLGEELLQPGEPVFEYWGHEASWIPMELYPAFEFRRREFRHHPWWGDLLGEHPDVARKLRRRVRDEGPLRSVDMEGRGSRGWWDLKIDKRVATALWSSGEFAIRERKNFQRTYDLAERVIPVETRQRRLSQADGFETLLLRALEGHGWATTGTLASTWRLTNRRKEIATTMKRLAEKGKILPCSLENPEGRPTPGWIQVDDRVLASRLAKVRPRTEVGVLLSPFDPLLWDRSRVKRLFGFDQVLEIFKPAEKRTYGYYCLPVLAGERLVARFDLKADRKKRTLQVLSLRFEGTGNSRPGTGSDGEAARVALKRYAEALGLAVTR